MRDIANRLVNEGIVKSDWRFRLFERFGRRPLRPGVYTLAAGTPPYQIVQSLRRGPPHVRLTFPEGWTSRQIAAHLEDNGVTEAEPFLKIVMEAKKEGFLFPDTYQFEQGQSPNVVIDRMIKRFHEMEPKDMSQQAKAHGLSYVQLVTLASLVEKEARVPDERPIIAGVFLNRLKKRWRLESCATVQYALGTWKPVLTYKDLDVDSPYNTYRHFGLPPGPVANPGAAALDAAAHPTKTDMMFFVAEGGGTHRFSRYYKDHLTAQRQQKAKKAAQKKP